MKIIKRYIQPLLAMYALLIALVVGCTAVSEDGFFPLNQGTLHLKVDPLSTVSAASGATLSVNIDSNIAWTASVDVAWAKFTSSDGSERSQSFTGRGKQIIVLTFEANSNQETRSLLLTVTPTATYSGVATQTVTITQEAPNFTLSTQSLEISGLGETKNIDITINGRWSSSVGDYGWIRINPSTGESSVNGIEIIVQPNPTRTEREGHISFIYGLNTVDVRVVQESGILDFIQKVFMIGREESMIQIPITCSGSWNASLSEDVNWCQLQTTEGSGSRDMELFVQENTGVKRECDVMVSFDNITKSVHIIQYSAPTPSVDETTIEELGKHSVSVQSSVNSELNIIESGFIYVVGSEENFYNATLCDTIKCSVAKGTIKATIENLESGTKYSVKGYVKTEYFNISGPATTFTSKGDIPGDNDHPLPDTP